MDVLDGRGLLCVLPGGRQVRPLLLLAISGECPKMSELLVGNVSNVHIFYMN